MGRVAEKGVGKVVICIRGNSEEFREEKRKDFQGEGGIMGKMGALKEKGRENPREVGNER